MLIAVIPRLIQIICSYVGGDRPGERAPGEVAGRTRPQTGEKQTIPGTIYRRPDPMIYDQYYLLKQGHAVTWDNPDIHLERPPGTPVSPHDLEPGKDYLVVASIWNLSEKAPAPGLPVQFSYLRFGIGGGKTAFAAAPVNLPVKGSPSLPARAEAVWTTPTTQGHYCLQVELLWPPTEDENPDNNLGQLNTDVKVLQSPAVFTFPVRNDDLQRSRRLQLTVDSYEIPPLQPCGASDRAAMSRHAPESFAIPDEWQVTVSPSELALGPGQEQSVTVHVEAPAGFVGRKGFNVNATAEGQLVGGVTLYSVGR